MARGAKALCISEKCSEDPPNRTNQKRTEPIGGAGRLAASVRSSLPGERWGEGGGRGAGVLLPGPTVRDTFPVSFCCLFQDSWIRLEQSDSFQNFSGDSRHFYLDPQPSSFVLIMDWY